MPYSPVGETLVYNQRRPVSKKFYTGKVAPSVLHQARHTFAFILFRRFAVIGADGSRDFRDVKGGFRDLQYHRFAIRFDPKILLRQPQQTAQGRPAFEAHLGAFANRQAEPVARLFDLTRARCPPQRQRVRRNRRRLKIEEELLVHRIAGCAPPHQFASKLNRIPLITFRQCGPAEAIV
jgi:hypothetical protein